MKDASNKFSNGHWITIKREIKKMQPITEYIAKKKVKRK